MKRRGLVVRVVARRFWDPSRSWRKRRCGDPPAPGRPVDNISKNTEKFASVFPQVAVSPVDPKIVAVAWRHTPYRLTRTPRKARGRPSATWRCRTMRARPSRTPTSCRSAARAPQRRGTGAVVLQRAVGRDRLRQDDLRRRRPLHRERGRRRRAEAGARALDRVERRRRDVEPGTHGITPTTFAPGMNAPKTVDATPWDGANGLVDAKTGAFLTIAGGAFAMSQDQAKTFGLVYQTTLPAGWQRQGNGTMSVSHGVLGAPFFATAVPVHGAKCPCLAFGTSADYGKTPLTPHLVAQADAINTSGTVRYPISPPIPDAGRRLRRLHLHAGSSARRRALHRRRRQHVEVGVTGPDPRQTSRSSMRIRPASATPRTDGSWSGEDFRRAPRRRRQHQPQRQRRQQPRRQRRPRRAWRRWRWPGSCLSCLTAAGGARLSSSRARCSSPPAGWPRNRSRVRPVAPRPAHRSCS